MVIDDALRIAGGSRCVIERDRIPFVGRTTPGKVGAAAGDELLVLLAYRADRRGRRIRDRRHRSPGSRAARLASALRDGGEYSRSVISTLASPCSSMKAIVSASRRVLSVFSTAPVTGTPKWHSIISGVLLSITATVSPSPIPCVDQRRCERRAAGEGLQPGVATLAMNHCDTLRVDIGGAGKESQRRQWRVIGGVLVEPFSVDIRHPQLLLSGDISVIGCCSAVARQPFSLPRFSRSFNQSASCRPSSSLAAASAMTPPRASAGQPACSTGELARR
jgi:hypothetical protein